MPVASYGSFLEIPESLRARCSYRVGQPFFVSVEWFRCLYESGLRRQADLRVYAASRDHNDAKAALFAVSETPGVLRSLSSQYTTRFALTGDVDELPALTQAIASERPPWDRVELRLLSGDDPSTWSLADALSDAGFAVEVFFETTNCRSRLEGRRFDQYMSDRPSRLTSTVKRRRGRLEAFAPSIRVLVHPGRDLDAGLDAYEAVYGASWKRAETSRDFIRRLAATCAELGILRLGIMNVSGKPAAAQLWIMDRGTATMYKTAYDAQFAQWSVGTVLMAAMFEHLIDRDGATEIDLGVGDEPYKMDWVSEARPLVGIEALNLRTARGRWLLLRRGARDVLRRMGLRPYKKGDVPRSIAHAGPGDSGSDGGSS
jgi:hypothetical protein